MKFYAHSLGADKDKWHTLADHLKDTGKLAGKFAAFFGKGAEVLAQQAGLLHDLGKYSHEFQKRLDGDPSHVDHSTRGAKVACERYGGSLGYLLAYAIAGHHTGLANGKGYDGKRHALSERLEDSDLPKLLSEWEKEIKLADTQSLQKYLKNMKQCKGQEVFQCTFFIRMLFSCLIDADRLDTKNFFEQAEGKTSQGGSPHSLATLQNALNSHLQNFAKNSTTELNKWRNKILTHVRERASLDAGIFSLTVPTGGGKTLTSLAFALDHALKHNLRHVIYVIPYTNIIEQTAQVFREALGKSKDAVLEHHSGFVADDKKLQDERYQGKEKFKLAMENWDAPIIVTTAVQFFESLFASSPSKCRKLHNISSSVIILDEVQTTPLHVLRPCVATLNELALNYRTSIVLCTATQPALRAQNFSNGFEQVRELAPEREAMFKFFERVTIHNSITHWSDDELIEQIKARPQVLCIVNNRRHARFLVDSLQGVEGVRLLTTLMCAKHRQKVLTEIRNDLKKEGKPCRLVATSLVEAGVDIDFPAVLRAEAGLDSIAQAAGRCNREGKRAREDSEVIIFTPDEKWPPPLELKQFSQVARGVLRRGGDALSPEAIEQYFEQLYWQKGEKELDSEDILQVLQGSRLNSLPFEEIDRRFKMIEDHQRPIIIAYDDKVRKLIENIRNTDKCGKIARQLQPYLVQVPKRTYDKMSESGILEIIAKDKFAQQFVVLSRADLYDNNFGLSCSDY